MSLQESAKLIHMVLTVLCARSSCREDVQEKREAKNKMTGSGHLFNLIKKCSFWLRMASSTGQLLAAIGTANKITGAH